jgi:hypothetical protein
VISASSIPASPATTVTSASAMGFEGCEMLHRRHMPKNLHLEKSELYTLQQISVALEKSELKGIEEIIFQNLRKTK